LSNQNTRAPANAPPRAIKALMKVPSAKPTFKPEAALEVVAVAGVVDVVALVVVVVPLVVAFELVVAAVPLEIDAHSSC